MTELQDVLLLNFFIKEVQAGKIAFLSSDRTHQEDVLRTVGQLQEHLDSSPSEAVVNCIELWRLLMESALDALGDAHAHSDADALKKYVLDFVKFEDLLFGADPTYRDHMTHSLWVYLLGVFLMDSDQFKPLFGLSNIDPELQEQEQLRPKLEAFMAETHSEAVFGSYVQAFREQKLILDRHPAAWCITALAHDLGYPFERLPRIAEAASHVLPYLSENVQSTFGLRTISTLEPFLDAFVEFLSTDLGLKNGPDDWAKFGPLVAQLFVMNASGSRPKELRESAISVWNAFSEKEKDDLKQFFTVETKVYRDLSDLLGYSSDLADHKHGLMSSLLLVKQVPFFHISNYRFLACGTGSSGEELDYADVALKKDVLCAIADHTGQKAGLTSFDSLSALLTIVDELEEFSRITRAGHSRQFVPTTCSTLIGVSPPDESGTTILNVEFRIPETALPRDGVKGFFLRKVDRFLSMFSVAEMDEHIALNVECSVHGNGDSYILNLRRSHATLLYNGTTVSMKMLQDERTSS